MASADFLSIPNSGHPSAIKRFTDTTSATPPDSVASLARGWRAKSKPRHPDITMAEIREMFKGQDDRYPLFLSNEQAAALTGIKVQSLNKQRCQGRYKGCYIPGNPVRFLRNEFMLAFIRSRGK